MDYAIELLEAEITRLEKGIRQQGLTQQNMREASARFKEINQLRRAIKLLKVKQTAKTTHLSIRQA